MKAPAFDYVKPSSLGEVFDLLERYGDEAKLLAGGQSLLATLNMRLSEPAVLVDINGIDGLAGIEADEDWIRVGALTRHAAVERSPTVARWLPLIAQAMPHVAHPAIRNRGTFGGSIALADPAAELPACSVALNGRFRIRSRDGERVVGADAFFQGLYETALAPTDVLIAAEFPVAPAGYRSAFGELARRHGDYAIVGLAAHGRVEGGIVSDLRLVFLGVGERPVLARTAATALDGEAITEATIRRAQEALEADLDPADDPMMPAAARRHLARVLLGRVVPTMLPRPA